MASFARKCSIGITIFGLIFIIVAIVIAAVVYSKLSEGIADKVTIKTSQDDPDGYRKWVDPTESSNPARYWNVYFFNLTNADDFVAKNIEPMFEEVGPYVFREYTYKYNVSFNSDNTNVSYNRQSNYTFVPELSSASVSLNDAITGLWVPYATAVMRAKGAANFEAAMAPNFLKLAVGAYANYLMMKQNLSSDAAQFIAASQWANVAGYAGSGSQPVLPPNTSYAAYAPVLSQLVEPARSLLGGMALFKVFPEFAANFINYPEHWLTPAQAIFLLKSGPCPMLGNNDRGIPCTADFQRNLTLNRNETLQRFGITGPQADLLVVYFRQTASVFLKALATAAGAKNPDQKLWVTRKPTQWLFDFADPLVGLANPASPNGAFFPNNNLSSFDAAFRVDPGSTAILTGKGNIASTQMVLQWNGSTVLPARPGGSPMAPGGCWCNGNETVRGHSDTQFTPGSSSGMSFNNGVSSSDKLQVWVDIIYRQLYFQYDSDTTVEGVDALRFRIADSEFVQNDLYSSYWPGLINLTCPKGGPPVMLTLPHYLQVNSSEFFCNLTAPIPSIHGTYVDVDPITGATVRGFQRLQINLMTDVNVVRFNKTTLYPSLWIEKTSQLTSDQASDYKKKIYGAFKLRKAIVISFSVIGSLAFVGGIVWFCVVKRRENQETAAINYQAIEN